MALEKKLISKKKPTFPINKMLDEYLKKYNRNLKISIFYDDLLRFQGSVIVYDKNEKDTLWVRTYYSEYDREEIDASLKKNIHDTPFRWRKRNYPIFKCRRY